MLNVAGQLQDDDGQPRNQGGYSVRKAINGSIRVARRAGK
jgi:hypothetical protein